VGAPNSFAKFNNKITLSNIKPALNRKLAVELVLFGFVDREQTATDKAQQDLLSRGCGTRAHDSRLGFPEQISLLSIEERHAQ